MSRLRIRHETTYQYASPVSFGAWRLLMRPADTHSVRVLEASFELFPMGHTRWTYDAYSNSVCHFTPQGPSERLSVVNHLLIERYPAPLTPLGGESPPSPASIGYDALTYAALAPFIRPVTDDVDQIHASWLREHAYRSDETSLDFVMRLNSVIKQSLSYVARELYGTQTPVTTLSTSTGTCRDFAWLMIESLRRLGFAARIVTGYIHSPGNVGGGATHAWCEVFLPDIGWIECDPTNGLIESRDLIRVASTRTPEEASPMQGIVVDDPGGAQMNVSAEVWLD